MSTGEKVLVIVLAETRAHEHTFQCFRENVLDVFSADLCLCVAESEFEDTNNPFYQHAKYIWTCPEHEDWGNAFDKAQREQGTEAPWRKLLAVGDQWLGGVKGVGQQPGSAAILLFFRWFLNFPFSLENFKKHPNERILEIAKEAKVEFMTEVSVRPFLFPFTKRKSVILGKPPN